MTLDGGGWTLVANFANDNNDYWTWNNRDKLRDGSIYGSLSNKANDFQSEAWNSVSGNSLLITPNDESKYLRYDQVLNNDTLKDIYPSTNTQSTTFTADVINGSWFEDPSCATGNFDMRTLTPDSDSHGWAEASVGFVWLSNNNDGGCWDDTFGGLSSTMSSYEDKERSWGHGNEFYNQNFGTSGGMFVFVK